MAKLAVLEPEKQAASFRVEFVRDWTEASARWGNGGDATVFQHRHWLDAWYRAFDTVNPVIAIISDTSTQRDVALVPLVCRNQHGVRSVEFADLGLSDYNAPILASNAPYVAASLRTIGSALLAALRQLPDRPDLIRLKKMPLEIRGRPNPLAEIEGAGSCSMNGNLVELGDDFEVYRASIRKIQMPRCWRVFTRHPGARFEIVTTVDEALRILDVMDRQQHKRMKQLGEKFILDEPRRAKFYRDVVSRGLAEGYAVVSALICDDGVVATTLGLRHGPHYSLLRNTNAGEQWSNFSPSRLCIERTMAALHGQGVRHFDFSIGNYDYKRRFGAEPLRLTDVGIALSWRGMPYVLRDHAVERLRRYPRLAGKVRRAAGSFAAVKKLWAR
ncbi:GNAT family N-acetyltransferase [Bradyrhizobium valentinum]|uniref:Cellulose biosynthesis protein CelD n=1 Tax=Bradyrhizobium valentinum TaxID=1518501 RepID=A0A0R3LS28_9BRAD|nr:GNAT family N-acetyltransferase [Bradyrhizobium valentinum]KRR10823.1 cellulose biosynthesis protein CelD [Bradyrhizobium valentinum]